MTAELFHADGRTDKWTERHDEAHSRFSTFFPIHFKAFHSPQFKSYYKFQIVNLKPALHNYGLKHTRCIQAFESYYAGGLV